MKNTTKKLNFKLDKFTPRNIVKLLKDKDKKKKLKNSKRKTTYKGALIRLTADFSLEQMGPEAVG